MSMIRPTRKVVLGLLTLLLENASAQVLPENFYLEPISVGWKNPTSIAFAGDHHLLVAEKRGLLWDVRDGERAIVPILDLSVEVLTNGDRGLLAVEPDPGFETNGVIYLLYVVDPNEDGVDSDRETFGRLTRFALVEGADGLLTADLASRTVLIGATWPQGIPSIHNSHSMGDLFFAPDGALLLSTGDGAHYDLVDAGGNDPGGFGSGKFPPEEDIGAFRSQSLTSLAGKILRVDPITGLGLSDNPYYTGDPDDNQSRVLMLGLRNPFRFTIRPETQSLAGKLHIGDVGWDTWEEIDIGFGGENFGWPCYEGRDARSEYQAADPGGYCQGGTYIVPRIPYHHSDPGGLGFTGNCTSGLAFYNAELYPPQYQGKLFFADYGGGWLRSVRFENGNAVDFELFGTDLGAPVDLIVDPRTGDLVYVSIQRDMILRIKYSDGNNPPVAIAEVTPGYGPLPLTVELKGSESIDPEGAALAYYWDLGDGSTSTSADLTHTYDLDQNYTAKLTVTDAGGKTSEAEVLISAGNTPPSITEVLSPPDQSFFQAGVPISLDAAGVDLEDDASSLPLSAVWTVTLIHDHHDHPDYATVTGFKTSYQPESHGPGTYLKVTLTVTDSRGLSDSRSVIVYDAAGVPKAHIASVTDASVRLGVPFEAAGHVEYPGLGDVELMWSFGDGSSESFVAGHQLDTQVSHSYAAPGEYRVTLTVREGDLVDVAAQDVQVYAATPSVAIFAPLIHDRWITSAEQFDVATRLIDTIRDAGFEAEFFTYSSQDGLASWMSGYLTDGIRDYVVFLDLGAEAVYAGEKNGSLAEEWLESGNGILWSGYQAFARYVTRTGVDSSKGAGQRAADDVLDAAIVEICLGDGHQYLRPPAADLPSLEEFDSTRALRLMNLGPEWSLFTEYASDDDVPAETDAVTIRHLSGGEYAQFLSSYRSNLKRAEVFTEFFFSTLFEGLPAGPGEFGTLSPADGATDRPLQPNLSWSSSANATSYLVEVARDPDFEAIDWIESPGNVEKVKVDEKLLPSTLYYWRVTARNDYGHLTSNISSFTTAFTPTAR